MNGNTKPNITVNCKCGGSLILSIPNIEMFFNVAVAQILLISDDPQSRTCPGCGLTWAPRFKMNIPVPELLNKIEWVAFQFKGQIAPPTTGDVKKFG